MAERAGIVWSVLHDELAKAWVGDRPVRVIDVGGGSGVLAVPLAQESCDVTVVDTSADALATLQRRAGEAGVGERIHALQGDVDSLSEVLDAGGYDIALCHSVLEVVDDPAAAVA